MERILLALDANKPSMPALDFACFLARVTQSPLTALFLENLEAEKKALRPVTHAAVGETPFPGIPTGPVSSEKLMEDNILRVTNGCENRSVRCSVLRDEGMPVKSVITQSRYADVLVVDAATSFEKAFEGTPTHFVKDVLEDAECPVIIAPESFDEINEVIFAYDGTSSAAFALKQFSYIFPQFGEKKATLVRVNEKGEWPEKEKLTITAWLSNHYPAVEFHAIKGDTESQLFSYLFRRKNCMVVMGAYGRSGLSRFLKSSKADVIIKTMPLPVFISHC
jgi:nucleotide-binding universal stress UspA family protein